MKTKTAAIALFLSLISLFASTACAEGLAHPWTGKTVAYFGDSITDPRNKAAGEKYWALLKKWLGITPYVYARSGRQWNDIPRQLDELRKEHGDNFDAIVILMGTNDYNHAVPLGRWYDEKTEEVVYGHGYAKRSETRMRRTPAMDPDTYRGRINIAIDSIKRTYPDKQLVLLTPLHRAGFYHSDTNWQVPEDYMNRCGEYLDAYSDAVVEAGKVWAVPVIDLGAKCGLYPLLDEYARYFNDADTDRLHPNDAGHRRMASTLLYQLASIPCNF